MNTRIVLAGAAFLLAGLSSCDSLFNKGKGNMGITSQVWGSHDGRRIEAGDLAGDRNREAGRVEECDPGDSGAPGCEAGRKGLAADAERRDAAEPGDCHPADRKSVV